LRKNYLFILILSVAIPVTIAVLIFSQEKIVLGEWIKLLPHLHGALNSATAIALLYGLIMVKKGDVYQHRIAMTTAFILGSLFLISYIIYHSSAPSVRFGDVDSDGVLSVEELLMVSTSRYVYLFLLLSHIGLSMVVVPLVLLAFYYALNDKIERHKRIVKFTWPIWFYVSVTGVLVYLMIKQYYS